MMNFDKFQEHAKRILAIPSHSESGNEELARYLQSLMHDCGMKSQLQPVNHSSDDISKRQMNLIGFVGDALVDRSTRRGTLFVNPLDVSTGNLPHLWTATQGNPQAPLANEQGIVGAGAVQGKLDFLSRIFAALELVDKRLKSPIYLVGTCGSHHGMMGSRFLIESLMVNPKEVVTFAPTQLNLSNESPGQATYRIDLESSIRDRDSRGYNRDITITAYGLGVDFSTPGDAINAFDLLMDLLLSAAEQGFDFQWSFIETKGASGTNPDLAVARIALTSFQLEDFKQFLRNRIGTEDQERFYRVDFSGISESGTRFIPAEVIEALLELDYEWKKFVRSLNSAPNPRFELPDSIGNLVQISQRPNGRVVVGFELRFLPEHDPAQLDQHWKGTVKRIASKFERIHFSVIREHLIQGKADPQASALWNTNYLSDAGLFSKARFPVTVLGTGSVRNIPKGPNEAIRWSELERGIEVYRDLMVKASLG